MTGLDPLWYEDAVFYEVSVRASKDGYFWLRLQPLSPDQPLDGIE